MLTGHRERGAQFEAGCRGRQGRVVCSELDLLEHMVESQFGIPGAIFAQTQSTCMCDHTRKSSQTFGLFSLWSPGLLRKSQDALQLLTKKVVKGKGSRGY